MAELSLSSSASSAVRQVSKTSNGPARFMESNFRQARCGLFPPFAAISFYEGKGMSAGDRSFVDETKWSWCEPQFVVKRRSMRLVCDNEKEGEPMRLGGVAFLYGAYRRYHRRCNYRLFRLAILVAGRELHDSGAAGFANAYKLTAKTLSEFFLPTRVRRSPASPLLTRLG